MAKKKSAKKAKPAKKATAKKSAKKSAKKPVAMKKRSGKKPAAKKAAAKRATPKKAAKKKSSPKKKPAPTITGRIGDMLGAAIAPVANFVAPPAVRPGSNQPTNGPATTTPVSPTGPGSTNTM